MYRRAYLRSVPPLLAGAAGAGCVGDEHQVDVLVSPDDPVPALTLGRHPVTADDPGIAVTFRSTSAAKRYLDSSQLPPDSSERVEAFIAELDPEQETLVFVSLPVEHALRGLSVEEVNLTEGTATVRIARTGTEPEAERDVPPIAVPARALVRLSGTERRPGSVRVVDEDRSGEVSVTTPDTAEISAADSRPTTPRYVHQHPDEHVSVRFDEDGEWEAGWRPLSSPVPLVEGTDRGPALRIQWWEDSFFGTSLQHRFETNYGIEPEAAHARYWIRHPEDWQFNEGRGTKLPGFAGIYRGTEFEGGWGGRSSDGTNGWSARMFNRARDGEIGLGTQIYHADSERTYGDHPRWTGSLEAGQWHAIDQFVQLNTPGMSNGIYRGWIDETPAIEVRNLRFRGEGYEQIRIDSFWINFYFGGSWGSPTMQHAHFTDLELWWWDRLPRPS